jgi:diguanylate cyclase (GGDEF)-like protein/PAS domain S-box-containing protein
MAEPGNRDLSVGRSIGFKLTLLIGATIAIGFSGIVFFFTQQQERNILLQNERTVRNLTQSVNEGLQTVMITGSADVAQLFADRLLGVRDVVDFRILRLSGIEAFRDNKTIDWINDFRGEKDFDPRPHEEPPNQVIPKDDPQLRRAIDSRHLVSYYKQRDGINTLTFLLPIKSEKRCQRCHGKESEVIGVLEFTTSLKSVEEAVHNTRILAFTLLALVLAIVLLITRRLLTRTIIKPLEQVAMAMNRVSQGHLDQVVPVLGRDELGRMATSFNKMTHELKQTYQGFQTERNKLETIIMGSNEGMVVTDAEGKVVLVNQAAELLLGKSADDIVAGGFFNIIDDPDRVHRRLEAPLEEQHTPDIVLYNERFLAVYMSSINDAEGRLTGLAALIRDMTEEKRLENMLLQLSNSDALTGLFNRRYLDEALAFEFNRAREGRRPLSVLMMDVDHFKKFNDTYGHDQGDRVLKRFADTVQDCVRNLDIACRYGGEEFLVIATETDQAGGIILAERIRTAVEAMEVDGLKVTTSIGVAGLSETGAPSPGELVERADAALYRAKEAGRNRSMAAEASAG